MATRFQLLSFGVVFLMEIVTSGFLSGGEPATPIGVFEGRQDVGVVLRPGAARFDAADGRYTVVGGGENIWAAKDAFHFVWKRRFFGSQGTINVPCWSPDGGKIAFVTYQLVP